MAQMDRAEQLKKELADLSERVKAIAKTQVETISKSNDAINELARIIGWDDTEKYIRKLRGELDEQDQRH